MGNRSARGTPTTNTGGSDYQYTLKDPHTEDVNLANGLNIPPPKECQRHDGAVMGTYFGITNICWILIFLLLIFILLLVGFIVDANVNPTNDWSSHGSRRYNDRHVPVSSIHKQNFDFSKPTSIIITANSTTSNPSIWDGVVVFTTWDGKIIAVKEKSGDLLWSVDICIDIYGLSVPVCDEEVLEYGRYLSRSTPTIWDHNVVISINGPADILVLNMYKGTLVSIISLTSNPFALVSQSGSIWDGQLYVGTSSNTSRACFERFPHGFGDSGCTFVGTFYRVDLKHESVVWATPMVNPDGVLSGDYNGFAGIPITGSSPPLSIAEGLVAFNTGNLTCWPTSFQNCVDAATYETVHESCYENSMFQFALFNSVVVLRMDDGSLFWHEKFYGYRTWDVSCNNVPTNPCNGPCKFHNDRYANCPTKALSKLDSFEYGGDPVLSTGDGGHEMLYVAQNSGLLVALRLDRRSVTTTNGRVEWATQVLSGSGIGGIAGDCDRIYFSVYNKDNTRWFINHLGPQAGIYGNTTCGGWGALHKSNGLPSWYIEHPKCGQSACSNDVVQTGGYSAPTVTNDLVLVTSGDVSVDDSGEPIYGVSIPYTSAADYEHGNAGSVYSLCTKNGLVTSMFNTGAPFYQQGISLKQRCAYGGNGYARNTEGGKFYEGTMFYIWCVESTHARACPTP